MADLKRFRIKLAKAIEKRKYKKHEREEAETIHAVASARRRETELTRKADITERRAAAEEKQAKAEEELAAQKASATVALKHKRAAKRKRVMSEGALRREQIRPILEAPKVIAKSIRAVSEAFGKLQKTTPVGTPSSPTPTKGTPEDPFPNVTNWLSDLDKKMK